jgi:enoyl-CoA hydratase/carnithine racemase
MSVVSQADKPVEKDASQSVLLREDNNGIATLTMNRPAQMNLLTIEMLGALQSAFDAIEKDAGVRVVVLAGAGKGFCAGHDLKEIRALGAPEQVGTLFETCNRMMMSIQRLPQPVIARVHGAAAAAGCQLVAQCDLAVASENAKFTTPGVNWGFFCSTPGVPIGRSLLRKHAMEMLLTGDLVDAAKALEWGLVNRVVATADLDATVLDLARRIAAKPPATIAAGKRAFYQQMDLGIDKAYELAGGVITASFSATEGKQGMDAFIDKRPPPAY